jgi:GAF domain-containing protein
MSGDELRAAVAAGVFGSEQGHRDLLRSIVEVARAIFHAHAASVFLLDEEADELVFEAIAGEDADRLIGTRFPSSTGIAGWVLVTRQPLVLEDVSQDPRFAKDAAESTGYVPTGLMAVPLLHGERALGVLEVLDRPARPGSALEDVELLGLFAGQAAIALDLLQSARRAQAALEGSGEEFETLARLATAIDGLEGEQRETGRDLIATLEKLLRNGSRAAGPPGSQAF